MEWTGLPSTVRVQRVLSRFCHFSTEQPSCPRLRVSDEHSFIVRVLRARRRALGCSFSILLRPRVREQERTPASSLQLFLQQLIHFSRVRLSAGGFHDLSNQETENLLLAFLELRDL